MALSTSRTLITKTGISTTQVFDMGGINISGGDFNLGNNIKLGNASGIITATSFSGSLAASNLTGALPAISGANLTNLPAGTSDKIEEGNSKVEVVDTGTGSISFVLDGSEKLNIGGYTQFNQTVFVDATIQTSGNMDLANDIRHMNNTGTRIGFPSNDVIHFRTNNAERLRITSTGRIGIGTDNPTDILDINSDQASAVSDVYIRNHANLGGAALNIWTQGTYSSPTYKAIIGASDSGGTIRVGAASNHPLLLLTNNTEKVRITTDGYVTKPNNLCLQYTSSSANYTSGTIIYGTKVFDVGTSNAYNTSNGEFTAPVTGVYRIQFEHFSAGAGRATARIEKYNGSSWSTAKNGMRIYSQSAGSDWSSVPTIFYLQLNATEKFRIVHLEGTIHLNTPWNHMTVQLVQ